MTTSSNRAERCARGLRKDIRSVPSVTLVWLSYALIGAAATTGPTTKIARTFRADRASNSGLADAARPKLRREEAALPGLRRRLLVRSCAPMLRLIE